MSKIFKQDRELSRAEKAQVVGFWRCSQNILYIMGIMELRQDTIESVLNEYFGNKLLNYK